MSRAARVTVLLGLAVGCGFQPASRDNPLPPPDGIAPYREKGPVALCQEGVSIVAEGPDAVGFCVGEAAGGPATCTADDQCASRERCQCGRCRVPHCDGAEDCRSGETCVLGANQCGAACATDDDCAQGTGCDRGRCAARCSDASACQRGESCSRLRGVCVAIACSADEDCADDERCEPQRARRDLTEPAVVELDGQHVLFVEDRAAAAVFRGTGRSVTAFELEGTPIVEDAGAPAPLVEDGGLVLYYVRADRSAIVRTDEGFEDAEEVLVPVEEWEGGRVDAPTAARLDGELVLAYEAEGGVGVARQEGDGWSGREAPAVTAATLEDPVLWRAIDRVGSPMLVVERSALGRLELRLFVEAVGAEGAATIVGDEQVPPPVNASIGFTVSVDGGSTFTPSAFNPTFARVAELGRYKAESDPWVLRTSGGWALWYVGGDVDDGVSEGLGVAVMGPVE